jgi:hexosaminidase
MEYMAFPRMAALAEVAWTVKERRDYADFLRRLPAQLDRLRALGVRYRPLDAAK